MFLKVFLARVLRGGVGGALPAPLAPRPVSCGSAGGFRWSPLQGGGGTARRPGGEQRPRRRASAGRETRTGLEYMKGWIQQPGSSSSMCGPTVRRWRRRRSCSRRATQVTNNNKFSPSRENKSQREQSEWKHCFISSGDGMVSLRKTRWSSRRRAGLSAAVMTDLITGLAPGAHLFQQLHIKPGRVVAHVSVALMAAADPHKPILLSHLLPRSQKKKKNRPDPTGSESFQGLQRSR